MNNDNFSIEIEGGIGELDYGGITLTVLDELLEKIAVNVVLPEVRRRIHRVTGETQQSVYVARVGWFNPRGSVEPLWKIATDILHGRVLEFGYGGRNAFMRPAARARRVKTEIRQWVKRFFGPAMTAQIRSRKRRKT